MVKIALFDLNLYKKKTTKNRMTCRELFLMKNILLLNGPNLNLLGKREPGIYGTESLESITDGLVSESEKLGLELISFQSNAEHELVDKLQAVP